MGDLNEARTRCNFNWDDAIERARVILAQDAPRCLDTAVHGSIAASLLDAFELGYSAGAIHAALDDSLNPLPKEVRQLLAGMDAERGPDGETYGHRD